MSPDRSEALLTKARALVDAVTLDDMGSIVGGQWMGGGGGLLSNATIRASDAVRQEVEAIEAEAKAAHAQDLEAAE